LVGKPTILTSNDLQHSWLAGLRELLLYRVGMSSDLMASSKKQYAAPKLNILTSEKAKTFVLDKAAQGVHEAVDLLSLLRQTSG
jgi:hypothetical protein